MKTRYENGLAPPSASVLRQQIAEEIKANRKSLNMTQQELADAAGTQKSNISRVESGKYNPTLDFLVKVAGSMGKSIEVKMQ